MSIKEGAGNANHVAERKYVHMADNAPNALNVVDPKSANTKNDDKTAKIAEEPKFASMAEDVQNALSARDRKFANTKNNA